MRGIPRDDRRLDELEDDLQSGLGASILGLEFVDRDLELEGELRVDYVGLDTRGRLLLVLLANEDDDATLLMALDVLVYARENLGLLARHLGKGRLRSDLGALVVLVAERFSTRLIARLEPLLDCVRLFEMRELRSKAGSASYLVPVGAASATELDRAPLGPVDFVTTLPEEVRELGYLAVRRVSRIDSELQCQTRSDGLVWRFHGSEICSLARGSGGLEGTVATHGPRVPIRTLRDVEVFVEEALAYTVEREADERGEGGELDGEEEFDVGPGPGLATEGGPILTEEEIQAFQQ